MVKKLEDIKCNVAYNGILIENNFSTEKTMKEKLKENIESKILFINSGDGSTPTAFQGYNLKETIYIRNYLNDLIDKAIEIITN